VANQPVQLYHSVERTDTAGKVIQNRILAAIPENEFRLLRAHLEPVPLASHTILYEPHGHLEFLHFPNDGVVSLVVVFTGGKTVEAGIVGKEGFVGIPATIGMDRSPLREVVQIAGDGLRIRSSFVRDALNAAPELRRQVEQFGVRLGLQVAQTAACNRLHDVEQRLARWLLMAQDRISSEFLPITHDFLATMLGTDRPSVSLAAGLLQKRGLIEYARGSVRILQRGELEQSSCECYGVIRGYTEAPP
jgi:CRP-like cAMP-binding protein